MFNKIYEKEGYIIFEVKHGYVVYNTKKEFKKGHSHLKNYKACVTAIDLARGKKIPRSKSFYFLNTLARISNDDKYIYEIKSLITVKKSKSKQSYRNTTKKK